MIWPLVWASMAALLAVLIDRGFFYRSIVRRIGEMEIEPWWMGVCFPITKATQYEVAIIPLNWILIYTWRLIYWIKNSPSDLIWAEFGEMYQENKKLQKENHILLQEIKSLKENK